MKHAADLREFNSALIGNLRLKTKILLVLFCIVLTVQVCVIIFFSTQTNLIGELIPYRLVLFGPSMMILAITLEYLMLRFLTKIRASEQALKTPIIYLVTFIEVSFPAILILLIGGILVRATIFDSFQMLNAPFYAIFFIMIILSSLLLDARLCLFAGLTGGIEYFVLNIYFFRGIGAQPLDYGNALGKSMLVVVAGLLAGFVSKKIHEAIISSLETKNELIYKLDIRVGEKTKEVVLQKEEIEKKNHLLEEKQKEIIDSIHYAQRIQKALITNEKYIQKNLDKLKNQNAS